MAELAVGLAKSVVEGTLSMAQTAIAEEAKLRDSAQRDLVFITGEFEMMQALLKAANVERVGNPVVLTWVRQIRELAYDVEDCIEFVVHLDKKPSWWWRMLPRWTSWCWCGISSMSAPLDEAVDQIEQLKARVEDVSTRNARYSLISDTGSKPIVAQAQQSSTSSSSSEESIKSLLMMVMGGGAARVPQGDLATQLLTADAQQQDLRVISVWGGNNLGVTSVIWKAYSDQHVCQIFTRRAWVKLIHPFNPHDFIRGLTDQFHANSCKREGGGKIIGFDVVKRTPAADSLEELERQLNHDRCLVVLEDLSTIADWDAISNFFPQSKQGSCIIVSTQHSQVATLSVGHPYKALDLSHFSLSSSQHSVYGFYKPTAQCDDRDKYCKKIDDDTASTSSSANTSADVLSGKKADADRWIAEHHIVGRDSELIDLSRCSTNVRFDSSQLISVWGISGVGKSSLVKKLFCDTIINDYNLLHGKKLGSSIFHKYALVEVSYPFRLRDFCRSLLVNFDSDSLETNETAHNKRTETQDPVRECCQTLRVHKCLVVIDGLKSTNEWDLIQTEVVPASAQNCIIVITTEASIATHCRPDNKYVYNVKGLEDGAAYNLLKEKVSAGGNPLPSSLTAKEDVEVKELVSKCGGLPKVIVEIGFSIGTKTVEKMAKVRALSSKFMHDLERNREFDKLQGLFSWLRTYFQDCPDILKPCIFYLSIFPPDFVLRRRRLVRRWIAEGYSRDNHEESAEQSGGKQFSALLDLSLIQQQPQRRASTVQLESNTAIRRKMSYQVNGFIREYIVSKRMEENLVFELGTGSAMTTQRTGRHLVILGGWKRDRIVFESMDYSRLRSLTVFGEWKAFFISESMKMLRVLDLENASEIEDEDDVMKMVVKVLLRLKFISFRGHREIMHLPGSFHKLRQLQTLDVRGTSITTLPEKITKLEKLQYIRAGTSKKDDITVQVQVQVPAPADSTSGCSCRLAEVFRCRQPTPASTLDIILPNNQSVHVPAPDSRSGCSSWLPSFCRSRHPTATCSADDPADSSSCFSWLPQFCTCHHPTVGVVVPIGIGKLTALHTLGVVDVAASGATAMVAELEQLTQLRKLGVSGINTKNSSKFFSAIQGHVHLESLSVHLDKHSQRCSIRKDYNHKGFLDGIISVPCDNLRSLKLYGLEDELPDWKPKKLVMLTKLELEMSTLSEHGIKVLGKLPELCILRVKQFQNGQLYFRVLENDSDEEHSYKKVKVLEIASTSNKLYVTFGKKTMKQLELLKVDCPRASSDFEFSDMKNLKKLKVVALVQGPNYGTQKHHLDHQLEGHPREVKPEVEPTCA